MRVLVISEGRPKRNGTLWDALSVDHEVDLRCYGEVSLREVIADVDVSDYDKIVFASGVRRLGRQVLELGRLPEVFVYDMDLQQDFMPESSYCGLFPAVLRSIRNLRLIVTSLASLEHYRAQGFAASYLPKAYDHRLIKDLGLSRDIEFGFVGRTNHKTYARRRDLLARIASHFPVQMLRTEDVSEESVEYNQLLNRIRFFISADAGFREFHIKNFEALAAGCVVCALRTSDREGEMLGFKDMENIVLYDDDVELRQKVEELRGSPERASAIAAAGRNLAVERHSWVARKPGLLSCLEEGVAPSGKRGWVERGKMLALRGYWLVR